MSSLVDNDLGMDDYPSPVLPMHPSVSNFFADEAMNASEESPSILQKDSLTNPSADEFDMLVDHLRIRLREGQFECIYEVGTSEHTDDVGLSSADLDASVETLGRMAAEHNAEVSVLRRRLCPHAAQDNSQLYTADCLVRVNVEQRDFMEIRVAVVGNVDAGKSTLLGVLTHGELDNGRGYARLKLFRHKHEIESGRTSSVGNDILGFDAKGQVTNNPDPHGRQLDWVKICEDSSKVLTFIDLAGHEKYLKTTVFGMTGHLPDYCMLMIGANMGVVGMTKEHLGLALALNVPVFVVLTKIDMCPPNVLQDTIQLLQKILKSPGCRKLPVMVQNVDDVVVSATNFCSERICPIFEVSNVTGHHLELLRMFLNLLPLRSHLGVVDQPAEFQIDETYSVPGVGTVVSGTCLQGVIRLNDTLMLGPDSTGAFMSVPVKSIHRKRMPVRELRAGQTASFSLKKVKRSFIRKGMVMVAPTLQPKACWEFEGDILVLHHPTTISPKYQAMVHCGSIRQTATIINMSRDCLRTGDKATVKFRFIKNPEYIKTGQRLVFREGRTKAVGNITKLQPYVPVPGQQVQNRAVKRNKPNQAPSNSSDQASANRRRGGRRQREFSALKEMGDQTEAADTSEMKIDE